MKILFVKLSSIGDVIHTLPVLSSLKAAYPEAEIDWVVEEPSAELLRGHPLLNRVLIFRRREILSDFRQKRGSAWRELKSFLRSLRRKRYDLVIDFQGLLKSGLLVGIARGRCKIGFANHREGSPLFYNLKLSPYDPDQHAVRRYLSVLKVLGLKPETVSFSLPPLPSFEELKQRFALPAGFAVFIPKARWPSKLWTVSGWRSLAQAFERRGILPIFVGSQADSPYVEKILTESPGLSLCGRLGLLELATLLKEASSVVSVDTGPMHLAAALGRPVVALFGPTAPWRTGPYGDDHRVLFKGLSCSPCFRKDCPDRVCLERISPEEVLRACNL